MNKGFTLIELMIVVAIVSVLATVAIPSFVDYRDKTREASAFSDAKMLITSMISSRK